MVQTFERGARLLNAADFGPCFATRQRLIGRYYQVHWCATTRPARLGLAVSRKADKRAVVRNRIKRVAREQFRLLRSQLPGCDLVAAARREAASASRSALAEDFRQLLQRLVALPLPPAQGTMPPAPTQPPRDDAVTSSG